MRRRPDMFEDKQVPDKTVGITNADDGTTVQIEPWQDRVIANISGTTAVTIALPWAERCPGHEIVIETTLADTAVLTIEGQDANQVGGITDLTPATATTTVVQSTGAEWVEIAA